MENIKQAAYKTDHVVAGTVVGHFESNDLDQVAQKAREFLEQKDEKGGEVKIYEDVDRFFKGRNLIDTKALDEWVEERKNVRDNVEETASTVGAIDG